MDIPLQLSPDFCGPPTRVDTTQRPLVTLKTLLSDRALTVKRPRQQPPSLIFSLPAEMIAEIFLQATAEDQDADAIRIPMHFHFVLSQVCGLWRAVAIHTPSLWSRVVLHLGARTSGFGGITTLARTCFERSCELPLALIITSSVTNADTIPNLSMDLVLPVRHRIRHLELRLPVVLTESIFKLPKNSLKALRSISVYAIVSADPASWFRSMSGLEGAPHLDRVKLACVHAPGSLIQWRTIDLRFDPYVARLPWAQLTDLHLQDLELRCDDAIYALEMATSLVRCALEVRMFEPLAPVIAFTVPPGQDAPAPPAPPKPKPPVTLPALLALDLAISGWPSAPADFFDRMILPSLKDLSIKYKDRQPLPCATLTALQTRSSFSLERFLLASRTGDTLLPFLQANPLLSRVQLVFCALELTPLAEGLTRVARTPGLGILPCLRALALTDRWTEEAPHATWARATKAVVEMARSRWRVHGDAAGARLVGFTFGSQMGLSAKKAERMERFRAEGMRLRIVPILAERAHLRRADYLGMNLWADED
ncbi:hypothetical protein B0H17DRAFT_386197 [Mycena rosella]|uniref:F-box domain-containing protein n=1 Tax=Mycena rosella TaxID=1033263 RepID=A0AAD7CNB0_MYCRO|nr:hypothetical protein B0H17DRAFT_386197 [Mycena rosella]